MLTLSSLTGDSWNQVWSASEISPDENKYTRIICPILLTSSVIALLFSVPGQIIDPWRWGGWVSREVASGLVVGGQPSAKLDESRRLYVNRLQIFTYQVAVPNYALIFDAAISGNVAIFAWEYVGTIE